MLLLNYKVLELPFEYPFEIAKGVKTEQRSLLVSLGLGRLRGYGEMTEISYYPESNLEETIQLLESKRRIIESYSINSPERFFHFLHHLIPQNSFLMSALDMAGWDLWSKMNRTTVQLLMGLMHEEAPQPTNFTIGMTTPEEVQRIVKEKPFPIYKLKVGNTGNLNTLIALRNETTAKIRIDVNEAWDLETALGFLPQLNEIGIELIEQPFKADDLDSLSSFKQETNIPVIADEACKVEEDLAFCLKHYDGVNIKLSKFGGLTPALEMIKKIKEEGKKVMLGGMCESTIGSTAMAQLLPLADYVDIDGPLLLKENFAQGLTYEGGKILLPRRPGLGILL